MHMAVRIRMDLIIKKEWVLPKINNDDLNLTFQLQDLVVTSGIKTQREPLRNLLNYETYSGRCTLQRNHPYNNKPVDNAPLRPIQQQQLPPIHHPPRQHQQRFPHQFPPGDFRPRNIFDEEEEDHRRVFREDLRQHENFNSRWENSFKVDIHGGLKGDDLIDWLVSVEEILDFKQVPPTQRVPLVAMRFRGHAATWWKKLKTTRSRTEKIPIQSWDKLLKHLRQTFLPHNYERTMYTRLQNLRQGSRTVDEYAEEFALLLTRNEINDSQIQLVSRFIGGLRSQLQTAMAQFDPSTISEAQQRAASLEQQSRSSNWNSSSTRSRSQDQTVSTNPATTIKEAGDASPSVTKPATQDEQQLRRSTRPNALRCYSCGEQGHRQTACPHATCRGLVINEPVDELDVYDSQEEDDGENDTLVHQTAGDSGHLLLLHRSCLAPRQQDDKWLRTSIFRSTCTIQDRICSFIIDSGSCRNVISEDAVKKLGITAKPHPAPYSLGWLSEGVNLRITQRALVSFSVGPIYKDRLYFDVAPMDISHLILGRPWEYDRRVTHEGVTNTYSFTWNAQQIVLLPSREPPTPASPAPPAKQATSPTPQQRSTTMLCSYSTFISELRLIQLVSRFIGGLRSQLQTAMAQFDPSTISEAQQRAASLEQQSRSSNWNSSSTRSRSQDQTVSTNPATTIKEAGDASPSVTKPATQDEQQLRRSTRPNALRCYSCGEQ
uniref:CCHC-type domain-containing protein n=1 Tax=Brassica oleracea var. oleracea TaxID=109376 RepID=A0A0D3E6J2_BRAOL